MHVEGKSKSIQLPDIIYNMYIEVKLICFLLFIHYTYCKLNYHSGLLDVNLALREIQVLQKKNSSENINAIEKLKKRIRTLHPDYFSDDSSFTFSRDIITVSTKYRNFDCDLNEAIRHPNSTTYLTFAKLPDGLGNLVVQLVKAMAFANYKGWNFLGVQGSLKVSFGIREDDVLNFYFGNYEPLLTSKSLLRNESHVVYFGPSIRQQYRVIKQKAKNNTVYDVGSDRFELERYIAKYHPSESSRDEYVTNMTNKYISPNFLSHLRRNAACGVGKALSTIVREGIDQHLPNRIKVVAHIRTGDILLSSDYSYKRIPLQFYPLVFATIRRICPQCDFYAFTSVQHDAQLNDMKRLLSALKKVNATLYIDVDYSGNSTDKALNTIAHLASADILLAAKSEFSVVSAYLNPNCVIYPEYGANFKLHPWILLPYMSPTTMASDGLNKMLAVVEDMLPGCMKERLSHKMNK